MIRPASLALILGALVLAGCSGGQQKQNAPLFQQIATVGVDTVVRRRAANAPRFGVSRAFLDRLEGSYLEVTLERSGIFAYLQILAQRRDDGPGEITVWRTDDNITLAMRNGVLIATRGLGGDILSSEVSAADGVTGPAGSGERSYYIRTRDAKQQRLAMACDLEDLGPQTITIVERAHATRHLRETCLSTSQSGTVGRVVNEYWVDSRRPILWQSVQWGGPYIGYMKTRRLTE